MWIPLRSAKMNGFILGFQRRVWWPKWTPASSSWRIETDGTVGGEPPVRLYPPRTLVGTATRRRPLDVACRHRPDRNGPRVSSVRPPLRRATGRACDVLERSRAAGGV